MLQQDCIQSRLEQSLLEDFDHCPFWHCPGRGVNIGRGKGAYRFRGSSIVFGVFKKPFFCEKKMVIANFLVNAVVFPYLCFWITVLCSATSVFTINMLFDYCISRVVTFCYTIMSLRTHVFKHLV